MMVELLVVANLLLSVSILVYFYFKEIKNHKKDWDQFKEMSNFMVENTSILSENAKDSLATLKEISKSKDDLTQKTLIEYLKHNEKLEKMILPQPVTRKAVQEILDRTPQMVPNDIDKVPEEIVQDELNEVLAKIPFTKNTKVAFEGDALEELPEEISDSMSGKLSD